MVQLKKGKFARLLSALALLAALLCLPVQAAGAPRAVLNAKDGVVRIFCKVGGDVYSGSGFLVTNTNSGAVVVTNYHVVQGASEMELYYDGNGPVDLTVMAVSKGQDLCLLQTPKALPGMAPLTNVTVGSPVRVVYLPAQGSTATAGIPEPVVGAVVNLSRSVDGSSTNVDVLVPEASAPSIQSYAAANRVAVVLDSKDR